MDEKENDDITPDEMAGIVKMLAEIEVLKRVLLGHLPAAKLTSKDFLYGVTIGIVIATDKFNEAIPDHLKKIVREAIIAQYKQSTN